MAGVTNYPFRAICREFGAGLYVSEMITARALIEGNQKTLKLADFGSDEKPRSLQLYGVDPSTVGQAVRRLVAEGRIDHLDLNFGCPVPKVTRRGGGSAIPVKPRLLASILSSAVSNAGAIPVTIKVRMGIHDELLTYREAGRIAEDTGCAAIGLHARTAAQLYDGSARWAAIGELKAALSIPVLGNGDIWEGWDALRMMRQTGCDGVIVGRGCLGRPWLFRDLNNLFDGSEPANPPCLGEVFTIMLDHAQRLASWCGEAGCDARLSPNMQPGTPRASAVALRCVVTSCASTRCLSFATYLQASVVKQSPFLHWQCACHAARLPALSGLHCQRGYLDDLNDPRAPGPEAEIASSGG